MIVSENFAELYGIKLGDHFTLRGKDGNPVELHVVGVMIDYTWNRGSITMDRDWYKETFGGSQVDLFHVYVRQGRNHEEAIQEVATTIRRKWGMGKSDALFVLSRPELREEVRQLLGRVFTIPYAQLLVVAVVVALGVVASLLISVLQRQRELGLLRAVGASRSQVLRCVLAEALLMGLIGSVIGLLIGIPMEWLVLRFIFLDETGFVFPVQIPWVSAGIVVGATLLVATLAGLLPALRAARLRITEAIAYE